MIENALTWSIEAIFISASQSYAYLSCMKVQCPLENFFLFYCPVKHQKNFNFLFLKAHLLLLTAKGELFLGCSDAKCSIPCSLTSPESFIPAIQPAKL